MSKRLLNSGIILGLILTAFTFPQLAATLFLNLANTQIARAVSLPTDAPDRAILLADADVNLTRARSFSDPSRTMLADARSALARNDATGALEIFNASGAALRDDSITQFTWADAAWRANRREEAFAHWRAANALEYFRQQMYRAQERREWRDAENFSRIAIGLNPDFADGYYVLGAALSHQDINDPEVVQQLDRARELTQEKELVAAVLSRKGEVLASQNKLRDALDVFSEARRIAPIDARPRTGYAITSLQLDPGVRDQSIVLLKEVVSDSPWYVAAHIALSNIYESNGQMNEAQAWLQTGLEKNPDHPALFFALGQFYVRQHRLADAKAAFVLALKNETHADLLLATARALAELPAQ